MRKLIIFILILSLVLTGCFASDPNNCTNSPSGSNQATQIPTSSSQTDPSVGVDGPGSNGDLQNSDINSTAPSDPVGTDPTENSSDGPIGPTVPEETGATKPSHPQSSEDPTDSTEPTEKPTTPTTLQEETKPTTPPETKPTEPPATEPEATDPPATEPEETNPPAAKVDASVIASQANSYAVSLGFVVDYSLNKGNSGYYSPDYRPIATNEVGIAAAKDLVSATKNQLNSRFSEGFSPTLVESIFGLVRVNCVVEYSHTDELGNWYYIYVFYG